ncbi:MAG: aldo/keto reductase [Saprospiraceae bacterium]|nr:aldo/keto reductase [Saprospiraceae bacterium]
MKTNHISRRQMLQLSAMSSGALLLPFTNFDFMSDQNKNIIKRKIPSSGEVLPAVGMGTWQTFDAGNNQSERESLKQVLKTFVDMGGAVIDSSPMYGSSEEVVGDLAAELKILDKLFMATKVWTSGRDAGIRQMNTSMKEMRSNPIDLMQVHNLVDFQTHIKTLREWKEEGKIRYIGATHYVDNAHDDLERLIKTEKLDFIQINYSLQSRNVEKTLLPLAQDKGVAIIINQPFESGSLFSKVRGKSLSDWAKDYDIVSWGQYFLKFIISHPAVTCVIPATSKIKHMEDNMGALYGRLPDAKLRQKMIEVL